jgi:hypothetical protein
MTIQSHSKHERMCSLTNYFKVGKQTLPFCWITKRCNPKHSIIDKALYYFAMNNIRSSMKSYWLPKKLVMAKGVAPLCFLFFSHSRRIDFLLAYNVVYI